jgi:divalent metal cation (Fe/Co/Zn/Cd) transporter
MDAVNLTRSDLVRRGQRLEYFTIGYNSLEGLLSIVAGLIAGSDSLVGFGLDSAIEVASGTALLWRLHHDLNPTRREQVERTVLRIVGGCFIALAAYIVYECGSTLLRHEAPERSIPGILIAGLSIMVMPLLARAKRRVAAGVGSGAMHADSRQTDFCMYLSAILLGGLLLNALIGWWWADPVAGLVMVPIIAKEGVDGIRGRGAAAIVGVIDPRFWRRLRQYPCVHPVDPPARWTTNCFPPSVVS